jgi:hypothetical protein
MPAGVVDQRENRIPNGLRHFLRQASFRAVNWYAPATPSAAAPAAPASGSSGCSPAIAWMPSVAEANTSEAASQVDMYPARRTTG